MTTTHPPAEESAPRRPPALPQLTLDLAQVTRHRNDARLLKLRDQLRFLAAADSNERAMQVLDKFDDVAVDRQRAGGLRRYSIALKLLLDVADILGEEDADGH